MLRATSWITTLSIGIALSGEAALGIAGEAALGIAAEAPQGQPTVAKVSAAGQSPRNVDYVVELPADDEDTMYADDVESFAAEDGAPQPLEPAATPRRGDSETITERFPNGKTHIEREVTQDSQGNYLNHGSWKMWDERGNIVAQGTYEYGNRTGEWIRWYRSAADAGILGKLPYNQFVGPFVSQATFRNDELDGQWTIYDGKLNKISQWTFAAGKRNGPSTWWYANGKKMREAQFANGDMDGAYLEWAPDGALKIKEAYEQGRKLGLKTTQHKGGGKKSEGMYLFAKDVEHSPDDWWNCKLLTTVKTGKDEKHGPWASWFPSGQQELVGAYEHDLQVGKFTWWHSNGQRALEGSFHQGKQDGVWIWWHANGQKSIEGEYAQGNPTGHWTWWKEDGRVVQSADLSHSEGVVIETPRHLDLPTAPRVSSPIKRQPTR